MFLLLIGFRMLRLLLREAKCASALSMRLGSSNVSRCNQTRYYTGVSRTASSFGWRKSSLNGIDMAKLSTSTNAEEDSTPRVEELHNIIADTERAKGPSDTQQFQAETKKLLDIVAHSLYSSKVMMLMCNLFIAKKNLNIGSVFA